MVAMCREGWNYLLIPSSAACAGIELFPPAVNFAVAVVRSPPKFVVSLVVLQRTTERVDAGLRASYGLGFGHSSGPVVFQIGFWPPRDRLWFAPLFFLYSSNEFADKRGDGPARKRCLRLYFGLIR